MTQRIAYYQVMSGLPGCIPNSHEFHEFRTRGDMVQTVNRILDWHQFPMRARRNVNLVEAWRYIQRGGRKGHFTLSNAYRPEIVEFVQISAEEYRAAMESENV